MKTKLRMKWNFKRVSLIGLSISLMVLAWYITGPKIFVGVGVLFINHELLNYIWDDGTTYGGK